MKKHIAASGVQAGQWVACRAINCRNGGRHVDNETLFDVQAWKNEHTGVKVPIREVTLEDVTSFEAEHPGRFAEKVLANPEEFIRTAPFFDSRQNKSYQHVLKAEKPRYENEVEVKADTVVFDNGFVGQRKLRSRKDEAVARRVEKLSQEVAFLVERRALTLNEFDSYRKILEECKYLRLNSFGVFFRQALTTSPESRTSYQQRDLDAYTQLINSTAKDRGYGYEQGTYKKYLERKVFDEGEKLFDKKNTGPVNSSLAGKVFKKIFG